MYDSNPIIRAEINKWLFWEGSQWQPLLINILGDCVGHKLLPDIFPAPQQKPNWHHDQATKTFSYLENHLSSRTWLVNERITLADYAVSGMATYFNVARFPFKTYPNISAWNDRISNDFAWKETLHPIWS